MKRRQFVILGSAAAALAGTPRLLFAQERIASISWRARADRSWLHGRAGACASRLRPNAAGAFTLDELSVVDGGRTS